jgi:hypothetical protein
MNKPKLELKNVKTFFGMEHMGGLNADLWINGVKCYFVCDEDTGGEMNFSPFLYNNPKEKEVRANIKLLNDYIASLPEYPMIIDGKPYKDKSGKIMMMKPDLSGIVDDLFNEIQKEKAKKKMQKFFEVAICYGIPDAPEYRYIKYKRPLSQVPLFHLQGQVDQILKDRCKNGEVIFNDNLKALGVKY